MLHEGKKNNARSCILMLFKLVCFLIICLKSLRGTKKKLSTWGGILTLYSISDKSMYKFIISNGL